MNGRLSTHVLDTARGRPAAGVAIALWYLGSSSNPEQSGGDAVLVARATTNTDGRTDAPLLADGTMRTGAWRLVFGVGDYYRAGRHPDAGAFLERVAIEFRIADIEAAYHVPLLVTPWSYSTYRGS